MTAEHLKTSQSRPLTFFYASLILLLSTAWVSAQELMYWDNYAGLAGGVGKNDGPGTQARFFAPAKVAVDSSGNVFVADTGNHTIRRVTPAGVVSTYAGKAGEAGSADGSRLNARFSSPQALAVHSSGDIYVADTENHTIRRISASGTVTTVGGRAGEPGDLAGQSDFARFNSPTDIAVAEDRTLYVVEPTNQKVKMINPSSIVSIFHTDDDFLSQQLEDGYIFLKNSSGIAINRTNSAVAIADTINHVIYRSGDPLITYGSPRFSGAADGNPANARFSYPYGVTFSGTDIYVTDSANFTIRKISSAGTTSTFAGLVGEPGSLDGQGTEARFKSLGRPGADSAGNIYVPDANKIRKISSTGAVTTLAGQNANEGSTNGSGTDARFNSPIGLARDSLGNVYVADEGNHVIRKISSTGEVSTYAGSAGVMGNSDGLLTEARFSSPNGVAVDSADNLYVADTYNHTIRKITPEGVVSTLAGFPGEPGAINGSGSAARFSLPTSITLDSEGNLYVADSSNYCVRRVTSTGAVTTYAGELGVFGAQNGIGNNARFGSVTGVAMDQANTLYVIDASMHTIRKVSTGRNVTTFAGSFESDGYGSANGSGMAARFRSPRGIAVDSRGYVFVSDTGNHTIRQITPGGVVSTIAGAARDYGDSSGSGKKARFTNPTGILVDGEGTIYVSDTGNNRIVRAVLQVAPTLGDAPAAQLRVVGSDVEVSISSTGTPPPTLQWLKNGKVIAGKKTNVFALEDITLKDAAAYTLRASNDAGTRTSAAFRLAVLSQAPLDVGVKEGGTLTVKVDAAGADLTYQWFKNDVLINSTTDSRISGERTAKLTIKGATVADEGLYLCRVSLAGNPTLDGGLRNVTIAQRPIVNAFTPGNWSVSQDVEGLVITAQNGGTKFSATGLPPGVKINAQTGELIGRPTQPKIVKGEIVPYKVKIVVTNPGGVSEPYTFDWLVQPISANLVGTFQGLVNHHPTLNGAPEAAEGFGGSIRFTTTSKGTVSGQIRLGAATHSFKGVLDVEDVGGNGELLVEIKRKGTLSSLNIGIIAQAANGSFEGSVNDGVFSILTNGMKTEPDAASAATYNIALTTGSSAPYPTGNGYAIFKLSAKGSINMSGRLADGTTLTGSTARGIGGNIPVHQLLYQKTGSIQGWLLIDEGVVSGTLQWMKNPPKTPKGNYRDGFSLHNLTVVGGIYTKPAKSHSVMDLPTSLVISFDQGVLETAYNRDVDLNSKNQLIPEDSSIRVKLVPNTGVLTGTFSLPLAEGETKPRIGSFAGLLIPGQIQAMGYFLAPETAEKNAPTVSGRLRLFPD